MIPPTDPVYIRDEISRLAERLSEARDDDAMEPRRLTDALSDALDALQCRERGDIGSDRDEDSGQPPLSSEPSLGNLGDHAVDLLAQLADMGRRMQRTEEADALEVLMVPLACCVARSGGELTRIGPVVNAAAALANSLREPHEIAGLFRMTDELFQAVSPQVSDAPAGSENARIWRVFIINRAIMATRTHQPVLMEAAFDSLIEHALDDAPAFFREGMEQMETLDYPAAVSLVMKRYYDAWCTGRRLH